MPLLPTRAAGAAACCAGRRLPVSPRSGLTPRPPRCSSSSQAVSPSVRALIAPEVLDSEPKVTPPSLVYTPSDLTSGVIYCKSVRIAGDQMDEAIRQHIRKHYKLLSGERRADGMQVHTGLAC